jgi:hypothetical protein
VFQQEQDVPDLFFFPESDQLLLQAEARGVVDCAELDYRDQILCATDLHGFTRIKSITTEGTEGTQGSFAKKKALRIIGSLVPYFDLRSSVRSAELKFMH